MSNQSIATETSQRMPFDPRLKIYIRRVLSILAGFMGLDRFYNQQIGLGVIKLITVGGFGIWWLVDAVYYTYKAGQTL